MRFTAFLAIAAIAVGSAAADTTSAGCIERGGVQICSGNGSPPVISVGPNGCTGLEIDGVQFCTTTAHGASTVRVTSTHTVATTHTTPTTQAATARSGDKNSTTQAASTTAVAPGDTTKVTSTATVATGATNSTTPAASTAMVVTGGTNSTVQTTATGAVATPSTTSGSSRIASLSPPVFFFFCVFVAFSSA